ncbi:hypothetical protein IM538_19150 [Cytobacillus suaedae]|nr:hypothetical protein IM538_19150 [Cytobacillus suaedae]
MKKYLLLVIISMILLVLAACNTETSSGSEVKVEPETDITKEEIVKQTRSAMFNLESTIIKKVREMDNLLYAHMDETVTEKPADSASVIGANFESELNALEIPAELKEHEETIKTALAKLGEAYNKEGAAIEAGETVFSESEKLVQEYIDAMKQVSEAIDMVPANYNLVF